MDIGAMVIRGWHKAKGWKDIGYHYVIRRDGEQEKGREDNVMGAHVRGHNSTSLGICLIGGTRAGGGSQYNFTNAQMGRLRDLVASLLAQHPGATVHGHNEFAKKACPCFDVSVWFEDNFGNDGES
jgi:N-acetylmuramoyl-L-alanine amidase